MLLDDNQKTINRLPLPIILNPAFNKIPGTTKEDYALGGAYSQDLAAISGARTFVIQNLPAISQKDFENILPFLNPQYYISFNPNSADDPIERKQIKVRVNRRNLVVNTRGSFLLK
jgi:hypothetical protein